MGRKCDRIGWNVTESDGIDWVFVIICDMTVTGWDGMAWNVTGSVVMSMWYD